MKKNRPVHPDFQYLLNFKDKELITLFLDARELVLELCPGCNEILYHTHALTSVFATSDKLQDAFCMLPIYKAHMNLGFNRGTLLNDPNRLLAGTGKLIRHVDIQSKKDYRNPAVKNLIREAFDFAKNDMDKPSRVSAQTLSKIKLK